MESLQYKKIVVKIGTSVLTGEGGVIDKKRIESIASQVSGLLQKGIKVIVVSSGAKIGRASCRERV